MAVAPVNVVCCNRTCTSELIETDTWYSNYNWWRRIDKFSIGNFSQTIGRASILAWIIVCGQRIILVLLILYLRSISISIWVESGVVNKTHAFSTGNLDHMRLIKDRSCGKVAIGWPQNWRFSFCFEYGPHICRHRRAHCSYILLLIVDINRPIFACHIFLYGQRRSQKRINKST